MKSKTSLLSAIRSSLVLAELLMAAYSSVSAQTPLFQTVPTVNSRVANSALVKHIRRSTLVVVDFSQLTPAAADYINSGIASADSVRRLKLNLFNDVTFDVMIDRVERSTDGTTDVWIGHIPGMQFGTVFLGVTGNIVMGNVKTDRGDFYQIRYSGTGQLHVVNDVDESKFPAEAPPRIPNLPAARIDERHPAYNDSGAVIDVMVVYTPAARVAAGGASAIKTLIQTGISETNQGYQNSQITQRINLVYSQEVSYTEESVDASVAFNAALDSITTGSLNAVVLPLRDQYKADLVSLWVNINDLCGIGWLMETVNSAFESNAYSVVSQGCATGYYSFAHEMGHNEGATHDREHTLSPGAYPYSYGYQQLLASPPFRTIMAYNCIGNCMRINYWSNPDVSTSVSGPAFPTGLASTAATAADNHLTLNNTALTVAKFRQSSLAETTLTFTSSATKSALNESAAVRVKLTATSGGTPIPGRTVAFVLGVGTGTETCSAATDVTGVAQCGVTPQEQPGAYTLTATFAGDASFGGSLTTVPFVIAPALAVTAPSSLLPGTVGKAYSATFQATGGTGLYTWSATGLPPDLLLAANGQLTGTPARETTSPITVTVKVSDAGFSVMKSYSLVVGGSGVQVVSVSPNAGSGIGPQTFQVLATDSSGYKNLEWVKLNFGSPNASCLIAYQQAGQQVYLYSDAGGILGPIAPNSKQSNSQCTVFGTGSGVNSAKTGGNNLTVQFNVSFKSAFAGMRNIYAYAKNFSGANSAWQILGSWTIPGQSLGVVSVSPINGSGTGPVTFMAVASDPSGASDLSVVFLEVATSAGAAQSCFAIYQPASRAFYLYSDDNKTLLGPVGSSGVSNHQCTLFSGSAMATGNNLTVPFKLQFLPGFTGTKSIFAYTQSASGGSGGWQLFGSWTPQ